MTLWLQLYDEDEKAVLQSIGSSIFQHGKSLVFKHHINETNSEKAIIKNNKENNGIKAHSSLPYLSTAQL